MRVPQPCCGEDCSASRLIHSGSHQTVPPTIAQTSAADKHELETLRKAHKWSTEELGRADAKVAALQQRLERAEKKLELEAARADGAEKLVTELESVASSVATRAVEQRKAEAGAAKAATAVRAELEKRVADAEAAALAARAAAEHAGTFAAKQVAGLQAQCSDLQRTLTKERALAASRAESAAAEAASALAAERNAAEAAGKQRNEDLTKFGARVEELEGAVKASQVPGMHTEHQDASQCIALNTRLVNAHALPLHIDFTASAHTLLPFSDTAL